jgi:uncharacterized protein
MAKVRAAKRQARNSNRKTASRKTPTTRRSTTKRAAAKKKRPTVRKIRAGVITHTELASADPQATRTWCERVLGWKFGEPMPTPDGPYHMWRFANETGGGIRANNPPEVPGSIPYCEVADIHSTFSKAIAAGATEMLTPQALPGGAGFIAIVAAPGGVAIGFWAMK